MGNPLVSIVLCTYNGARYLAEQVESLLQQTYAPIEIIAIDDGSVDDTVALLKKFSEADSRFRFFINEKNKGVTKNFESGIEQAQGAYIAFSDQDDVWDKDKIRILMEAAKHKKLVYCDSAFVDEQGALMGKRFSDIKNMRSYEDAMPFFLTNCISGHAMLVEKRFVVHLLPFSPDLIYDRWIAFYAAFAKEIEYVDQVLVYHRQHANNAIGAVRIERSPSREKSQKEADEAYRKELKFMYQGLPDNAGKLKMALGRLIAYSEDKSVANNLKRMLFFFRYSERLMAIKKRNKLRRMLFCVKMFFKIQ